MFLHSKCNEKKFKKKTLPLVAPVYISLIHRKTFILTMYIISSSCLEKKIWLQNASFVCVAELSRNISYIQYLNIRIHKSYSTHDMKCSFSLHLKKLLRKPKNTNQNTFLTKNPFYPKTRLLLVEKLLTEKMFLQFIVKPIDPSFRSKSKT